MRPLYSTIYSSYMEEVFGDPEKMITRAKRFLQGVEYDTMVGRGLSGSLAVPMLARALGKHWAIVRKDDGSHSYSRVEGTIGARWLFVDDFISTGNTEQITIGEVSDACPQTEYVGAYLYSKNASKAFRPAIGGVGRIH